MKSRPALSVLSLFGGLFLLEACAPPPPPVVKRPPPPPEVQEISPAADGLHDVESPGTALLQDPVAAMAGFPRDRRGQVDWNKALAQKLIEPRADLSGEGKMEVMDLNIIMRGTRSMPYVRFSHKAHTEWLDCSNCHPAIFEPRAGANPMDMGQILGGEYCGICHDRVAFSLFTCERCHSVPHGDVKKWW